MIIKRKGKGAGERGERGRGGKMRKIMRHGDVGETNDDVISPEAEEYDVTCLVAVLILPLSSDFPHYRFLLFSILKKGILVRDFIEDNTLLL